MTYPSVDFRHQVDVVWEQQTHALDAGDQGAEIGFPLGGAFGLFDHLNEILEQRLVRVGCELFQKILASGGDVFAVEYVLNHVLEVCGHQLNAAGLSFGVDVGLREDVLQEEMRDSVSEDETSPPDTKEEFFRRN